MVFGFVSGLTGLPKESTEARIGSAMALLDLTTPPVTEALNRFWLPPVPLPPRPPTLDVEPDLLLRQLPDPGPELGGPDLVDRLRPAYRRFSGGVPATAGRADPSVATPP